jgi:hypothetical protein
MCGDPAAFLLRFWNFAFVVAGRGGRGELLA